VGGGVDSCCADGRRLGTGANVLATGSGTFDRAEGVSMAVGLNVDGERAACTLAIDLVGKSY